MPNFINPSLYLGNILGIDVTCAVKSDKYLVDVRTNAFHQAIAFGNLGAVGSEINPRPNKAILEIIFFSQDDFYNICFQNNNYLIVGWDQGVADNVIAIATNGKVYYITLHNNDVCYIAKALIFL